MNSENVWRRCASCKKEIPFGGVYQKCSVSSCRKSVYCSVTCWDVHVPVMNHKSAWAEEERAPRKGEEEKAVKRKIIVNSPSRESGGGATTYPHDILIVASKLKAYVKAKHGVNTSSNVLEVLSDIVRFEVDKAVEKTRAEGRKTLLDRDF